MFRRGILRLFLLIGAGIGWCANLYADPQDYFQIVYDTSEPAIPGLKPDFGYAVYIHVDGKRILLDTGTDPDIIQHNLVAAGVDVTELDMVVVSHSHHDHAGGLARIRRLNPGVPLFVPPGQDFGLGDVQVVEDHLQVTSNLFVIRGHADVPAAGISDDLSVVLRSRSGSVYRARNSGKESKYCCRCSIDGYERLFFQAAAEIPAPGCGNRP